jgi:hypothetical protein
MKQYLFIVLILMIALSACKKNIQVDLNNAPSQLVIEGMVTNASTAQVTITKSVIFSSNNVFPTVSGAVAVITDNLGHLYTLTETAPGNYTNSSLTGVPGRTYNLSVTTGGINYLASSTMPQQVNLDTVLTEKLSFISKQITIIKPQYTDPSGFGNYYQFIETINHTINKKIFIWDDKLNDGGTSTRPLIEADSTINTGDTIKVEMHCIDKNIFRYFTALQDFQNNSATPANPDSNISGGCLGYFSAHTSQQRKVRVP